MSTTIMNAIANLDLTDFDEIDTLITALKERKKALRTEKTAITKAEKAAEKARLSEVKKAEAENKKAEKDAAKVLEREAKKASVEANKARKEAEKLLEREAKKAAAEAKKVEKAAAKATMKTLQDLQKATLKSVKRETEGPPKPKNASYQNFCKWSKGDDAPTEEELTEAGGRREWLKKAWSELTKDAQNAPDAPWNSIAA